MHRKNPYYDAKTTQKSYRKDLSETMAKLTTDTFCLRNCYCTNENLRINVDHLGCICCCYPSNKSLCFRLGKELDGVCLLFGWIQIIYLCCFLGVPAYFPENWKIFQICKSEDLQPFFQNLKIWRHHYNVMFYPTHLVMLKAESLK